MLNEACSVVKCLDDRTLQPKLEEIRGLTNSLKRVVPHFQRIHIGERSHWNRKQADKTLKVSLFSCLYLGRGKVLLGPPLRDTHKGQMRHQKHQLLR